MDIHKCVCSVEGLIQLKFNYYLVEIIKTLPKKRFGDGEEECGKLSLHISQLDVSLVSDSSDDTTEIKKSFVIIARARN